MLHNEARKLLVEGYEATHNAEAIAKIFHVNKYTVYHLEERKRKTGSVDLQTWRRGRKALLSSADKARIAERITKNSTISLGELRTQLGLKVSISTMSRVVRALGFHHKSSTDFLIILAPLRKCRNCLEYQAFPAFCVSEDTPHIMAYRSLIWRSKVVKP